MEGLVSYGEACTSSFGGWSPRCDSQDPSILRRAAFLCGCGGGLWRLGCRGDARRGRVGIGRSVATVALCRHDLYSIYLMSGVVAPRATRPATLLESRRTVCVSDCDSPFSHNTASASAQKGALAKGGPHITPTHLALCVDVSLFSGKCLCFKSKFIRQMSRHDIDILFIYYRQMSRHDMTFAIFFVACKRAARAHTCT